MQVIFHLESPRGFSASLRTSYPDRESFNIESPDDFDEWAYKTCSFNHIERAETWIEIVKE